MTAAAGQVSSDELNAARGLTLSFIGGLLLSLDVPLLKLSGADTWTIIYVRGTMLFAAMFTYWVLFRRLKDSTDSFLNGWTGLIITLLAATANFLFVFAIGLTSVANVVFILAFNPMFAGLLSWLFLNERLPVQTWAAIVASLCGVGLIVASGLQLGTWRGDLMALGVSITLATSLVIIRHKRGDYSMSAASGHLLSAAFAAPFAMPGTLSAAGWGWLAINGFLVAPLANAFLIIGPRYVAAAIVAMFFLLETVLTPVWMWMIFTEIPSPLAITGGVIVIVALIVHSSWKLAHVKKTRQKPRRRS